MKRVCKIPDTLCRKCLLVEYTDVERRSIAFQASFTLRSFPRLHLIISSKLSRVISLCQRYRSATENASVRTAYNDEDSGKLKRRGNRSFLSRWHRSQLFVSVDSFIYIYILLRPEIEALPLQLELPQILCAITVAQYRARIKSLYFAKKKADNIILIKKFMASWKHQLYRAWNITIKTSFILRKEKEWEREGSGGGEQRDQGQTRFATM